MDAPPVGRHDAQEAQVAAVVFVAQFEVADDEQVVERGVLREAAHPLERDPCLIAARGADRDGGAGRGEQVMQRDLCGDRRLRVAPRQDRADLAGRPEVRPRDPLLVWMQRLVDAVAEFGESREAEPDSC